MHGKISLSAPSTSITQVHPELPTRRHFVANISNNTGNDTLMKYKVQ
jgi:hypothetical protein